jgi:hypothetical protein
MSRSELSRRKFLVSGLRASGATVLVPSLTARTAASEQQNAGAASDREQWIGFVERVSSPVLEALSRRELRRRMPVEVTDGHQQERAVGSPLEAFGRLLSGLAPWLELDSSTTESSKETALRAGYRSWSQQAVSSALDPSSPDYMQFGQSGQTLVDSSFLALAFLRAPKQLLDTMTPATRAHLITALEIERKIQPPLSNWLLFPALNEALLRRLGANWERPPIDRALKEHQSWYLGDGTYGDGPQYHADFYNSYVIHPYLLALMDELGDEPAWRDMAPAIVDRARRYAAIQERTISPSGEFPVLGRSITYRAGAFHLLADVARRQRLPPSVLPGAVRCALTAVQQRTLTPPGTFSPQGWLQIGLAGHQPSLGENYISTGSLYLCSAVWLPLGLPPADPFWSDPPADWSQKKVWAGLDAPADHAITS